MKRLIILVLVSILVISSLFVFGACNKKEPLKFEKIQIRGSNYLSLKLPSDFIQINYDNNARFNYYLIVHKNDTCFIYGWDRVYAPVYSGNYAGSSSSILGLIPNETIYIRYYYQDFERIYLIKSLNNLIFEYIGLTDISEYLNNPSNYQIICDYIF